MGHCSGEGSCSCLSLSLNMTDRQAGRRGRGIAHILFLIIQSLSLNFPQQWFLYFLPFFSIALPTWILSSYPTWWFRAISFSSIRQNRCEKITVFHSFTLSQPQKSVCLSVCPSVILPACLSACLSVCLSSPGVFPLCLQIFMEGFLTC